MIDRVTLNVEGMSCGHCVKAIEDNVSAITGVDKVKAHLDNHTVDIEFNKDVVEMRAITQTIEDQGYTVTN